MVKAKLFKSLDLLAVALVLLLAGCSGIGGRIESTGSVLLSLDNVQARSILPPISMDVAEYLVSGSGPSGATYGPAVLIGSTVLEDMLPGPWTFQITARNAAHNALGEGAGGCTVVIGQTATCSITVAEYGSPDGSFLLDLAWEPSIVNDPVWTGTLKDFAAVVTPMAFTANEVACTAQSTVDPLHVGWFTMIVQLFDAPTGIDGSEVLSTGAAAAVRIAAGRQTHGDLFLHAVQGYGGIDLQLNLDFNDELILTPNVAFGPVTVYAGQPKAFSVTADETATAIYYLSGQQVGIDGYTINPATLLEGEAYRLDVVCFNVAGDRAASGTWTVTASSFNPELILGSFTAEAGDYEVKIFTAAYGLVDTVAITSAGGVENFSFTGLAAGSYKLRVHKLPAVEGVSPLEWWQEHSAALDADPITYPLAGPTIFDFGTIDYFYN